MSEKGPGTKYLHALIAGSPPRAAVALDEALLQGLSLEKLYSEVITPALVEIGHGWERGHITEAIEHRASEITRRELLRLQRRFTAPFIQPHTAVVATVEHEQHALGAQMVANVLLTDGWNVEFLGSTLPARALLSFIQHTHADVACLSCTLSEHLDGAYQLIDLIHEHCPQVPILVGGQAFNHPAAQAVRDRLPAHYATLGDLMKTVRTAVNRTHAEAGATSLIKRIGLRVQQERKRQDMTQQELAERAAVDRSHLSGIENGRQNVTVSVLAQIAGALHLPIEDLLCSSVSPSAGAQHAATSAAATTGGISGGVEASPMQSSRGAHESAGRVSAARAAGIGPAVATATHGSEE